MKMFFRLTAIIVLLISLIPISAFAMELPTTVQVNKMSYAPGESVSVFGETGLENVNMKVLRPDATVLTETVIEASLGSYEATFSIPYDAMLTNDSTNYTVVVGDGLDELATTTFKVRDVPPAPISNITLDEISPTQYKPGEIVIVSGVTTSPGTLTITFLNPNVMEIKSETITSLDDGTFTYEYRLDNNAPEGIYNVVVSDGTSHVQKSFEVIQSNEISIYMNPMILAEGYKDPVKFGAYPAWQPKSPSVVLKDSNGNVVNGYISNVVVNSMKEFPPPSQEEEHGPMLAPITFEVAPGLAAGKYNVEIKDIDINSNQDVIGKGSFEVIKPNFQGTIKKSDGTPVGYGYFTLAPKIYNNIDWSRALYLGADSKGDVFTILDENIEYFLVELYDGENFENLGVYSEISFTIAPGSQLLNQVISLPKPNVSGKLLDSDGITPIVNSNFMVVDTTAVSNNEILDWTKTFSVRTDENGNFSKNLPKGVDYKVWSIWSNQGGYLDTSKQSLIFSVANPGPTADVKITLPAPNLTGKVTKGGAGVPFAGVTIFPESSLNVDGYPTDWSKAIWVQTDRAGNFKTILDTSATTSYKVFEIYNTDDWLLIDANTGQIDLSSGQPVNLNLSFKTPNVTGTLTDANGKPMKFSNFTLIGQSEMAKERWNRDWSKAVYGQTDDNGKFGLNLEPGTYYLNDISKLNFWEDLSDSISEKTKIVVPSSGEIDITIGIPTINFQGEIRNRDGSLASNAYATLMPVSAMNGGEEQWDWSKAIEIQSDIYGKFKKSLAEDEYQILSISTAKDWEWRAKDQTARITVPSDSAVIGFPTPNINGQLKDENGTNISKVGWINVIPVDAMSNESDWQGERLRWIQTNPDGSFKATLEDGVTYQVLNVSFVEQWLDFSKNSDMQFEVVGGQNIVIQLPKKNVTGTIMDDNGNALSNVWVSVAPINSGEIDWKSQQWFITNTQGKFAISLPKNKTYRMLEILSEPKSFLLDDDNSNDLVVDGSDQIWDVNLSSSVATINGTVTSTSGKDLTGASISYKKDSGEWKWATVAADNSSVIVPVLKAATNNDYSIGYIYLPVTGEYIDLTSENIKFDSNSGNINITID